METLYEHLLNGSLMAVALGITVGFFCGLIVHVMSIDK